MTRPFFELPRKTRLHIAHGLLGHEVIATHCPQQTVGEGNRVFIGRVTAVGSIPLTLVTPDILVLDLRIGDNPVAVPLDEIGALLSNIRHGDLCPAFHSAHGSCALAAQQHEAPTRNGQAHANQMGRWYS